MSALGQTVGKAFQPIKAKIAPVYGKYRAQFDQRWNAMQTREQRMLQILAVFLGIFLFWYLLWLPLDARLERAEMRFNSQQSAYQRVADGAARVESARANQQNQRSAISANQLSGFVNTLTSELDMEVARIQPQQDSWVLTFNEVEFDALITLTARLIERGVIIEAMDAAETSEAGIVRVRRLQIRAP
ncbi:type II secretion system protein GspM [Aliidiomarina sanyensis]|uniref:Type II secretion system protein M n=1 Tax=Aliidiomarina sanyensis TaxID=1249555 RepID=A0A432WG50_9GAMM|nr:type II secretion system protein M [Aliidiomarina sanyensis]RUO32780.1 hypothetical protein CWE11_07025 [Aliidiomarina sanyensis]